MEIVESKKMTRIFSRRIVLQPIGVEGEDCDEIKMRAVVFGSTFEYATPVRLETKRKMRHHESPGTTHCFVTVYR